ncbi:MAG: ATP-dependent Clp protease proteolytic subunit [Actinomycetota bacterium]|nr:MAG: ATP-dependent Clp protease proteolytic subunit [Actinomycetota bacterium]
MSYDLDAVAAAAFRTSGHRGHAPYRAAGGYDAPTARYVLPEFRERHANGERIHNPYTKLFEERIIFLGVQIDDASADDVMAQLLCLESMDPDREISIYINSPGGSYTAMTAIYDTMQFVKPQIQTVCLGQAASAAAVLLAAGTPGKRFALPHSRILIHQPYTEGGGQGSDIEIQANEILRMRSEMQDILALHTGRTAAEVEADIERDKILTAEAAKEYGIVDSVISSRKSPVPA